MKKYLGIFVIVIFAISIKQIYAQTLSIECTDIAYSDSGAGECIYDAFCSDQGISFNVGEYCQPVSSLVDCLTLVESNTRDGKAGWPLDQALYCRTDAANYCCEVDESGLVDDSNLEDRIECSPSLSSLEEQMVSQATLDEALEVGECEQKDSLSDFGNPEECDVDHRCIVDVTSYYCCGGYVAEGEPEELEVTAEDTFVECSAQGLSAEETQACANCMGNKADPTGAIWTELGCIDPSPAGLITRIFQIGLGVMGGIALLRTIQIAIAYQSDDPEQVKSAQEMLTSLVAGLILLAGGVVILQFVGVNILGIPREYLGG